MKKRTDGTFGGPGSRRNWFPKSSGTSGEVALAKALQDAKILYHMQVQVKTRFKEYPFNVDFMIPSIDRQKYLGLCVEVDGGLHRKTWRGKPAIRRMAKDEAKTACLEGEGYRVLRVTDTEVKKYPDDVIARVRGELAK